MFYFLEINLFSDMAIFLVIVVLIIFLWLIVNNRKLKRELEDLKLEDRNFLKKEYKVGKEDIVSIDNISKKVDDDVVEKVKNNVESIDSSMIFELESKPIKKVDKKIVNRSVKKIKKSSNKIIKDNVYNENNVEDKLDMLLGLEPIKENVKSVKENKVIKEDIVNLDDDHSKPKGIYTKNVLHDVPKITSPISLDTQEFDMNSFGDNLNEFVRHNKKKNNKNKKGDYLGEISKKIAENLEPQTIELTSYEKMQEDNAIISYRELLNVKNNLESVEDDVGDFIEELKKFSNNLN
jgi:hypothetical protein